MATKVGIFPATHESVTWPRGRDRKIRTSLRANQIAGFVTVPSDEKNASKTLGTFSKETAPGSEVLLPFEVVHLARSRLGSAPTSKGLFSRCIENVSRYEAFVCL